MVSRTENEAGYSDGYRVGPDGVDPDGEATHGYNEELFARPDYRAGLSEGRSDRIDENLIRTSEERQALAEHVRALAEGRA